MKKHSIRILFLGIGLALGFLIGRTEMLTAHATSSLQGDGGDCSNIEELTDINAVLSCLIQIELENKDILDTILVTTQDTYQFVQDMGLERQLEGAQTSGRDQSSEEEPGGESLMAPIELSGSGPSVVDITKGEYQAIAIITGNDEGQFFSVNSYAAGSDIPNLLVNTSEPYQGIRPLDLENELTTRLKVQAAEDWSITILPATEADVLTVPGIVEGSGDTVLILDGTPDTATVVGNPAANYFSITGHGEMFPDLIVNSIKPYEGTVPIKPETVLLEIQAEGPWSIVVE